VAVFWDRMLSLRMPGSQIFTHSLGRTIEGRDMIAHANFDFAKPPAPADAALLIGGTHGNEPATVRLLESFLQSPVWGELRAFPAMVLPLANPDGAAHGTRYNARGIDLNRNCGFNWRA